MNLDNVRKKLHGPIFPTITPFKEGPDYEVDYESLKEYVDFLYDAGARAFYVMTYNGRFSLLFLWKDTITMIKYMITSKPSQIVPILEY